jgi:hypothetical protein
VRQHSSWQRRRVGVTAILERIAHDPGYREHLLDSPAAVARAVGGPATADHESDVVGYRTAPCRYTCGHTCAVTYVTK